MTVIEKIKEDFATEADQKKVIALLNTANVVELSKLRNEINNKVHNETTITAIANNEDNDLTTEQKSAIIDTAELSATDLIIKNLLDVVDR